MLNNIAKDFIRENSNINPLAYEITEKPYIQLDGGGEVNTGKIQYEIPKKTESSTKKETSTKKEETGKKTNTVTQSTQIVLEPEFNTSSGKDKTKEETVKVVIEKPPVPEDNIAERKNTAKTEYETWKETSAPQYESKYATQITEVLKELSGREFSYDHMQDDVYKRYRDSVKTSAQLAMADAVGLSAALNGGYSTSYAQLAGQAAYMNRMKEADEILPELYEAAYDRFSRDTDDLEDNLEILRDLENDEWEKYTDLLSAHNEKGEMLYDRYNELSNEEFDRFYSVYKLAF